MLSIFSFVYEPFVCLLWRLLNFKPAFSFFSFTFIKRLFSSSLLSVMRSMSSAFLKLLMILPAIFWFHLVLHPAWHFSWRALHMKVKVTQSYPTLCDPMDYTVHGILQTRILEWVAFPFSRGSSQPKNWTQASRIAGEFFTSWATREAQEYWSE